MNKTRRRPTRREKQKEVTRTVIVDIARDHFEEHGFERTSIRAIAADAGVAPGTVLTHFEDKRDLLNAALFDDLTRTILDAIERPARGPLLRDLLALARAFLGYYAERPALSRALLKEALLAEKPWAARYAGQVTLVHEHVVHLVDAARSRGEPGLAGLRSAAVSGAFLSFYYFALLGWVQGAYARPLEVVESLLAQHLRRKP
jgi:AcrR family transcriptional regulator